MGRFTAWRCWGAICYTLLVILCSDNGRRFMLPRLVKTTYQMLRFIINPRYNPRVRSGQDIHDFLYHSICTLQQIGFPFFLSFWRKHQQVALGPGAPRERIGLAQSVPLFISSKNSSCRYSAGVFKIFLFICEFWSRGRKRAWIKVRPVSGNTNSSESMLCLCTSKKKQEIFLFSHDSQWCE